MALDDHKHHLNTVTRFAVWRHLGLLIAAIVSSACALLRSRGTPECSAVPASPLIPFLPAQALALAGTYDLTLVADSGPRAGRAAHGTLAVAANDTLHRYYINPYGQNWRRHGDRPLIGWTDLRGDVGLVIAGTALDSRDPAQPGVAFSLDSLHGGLRFMLGYRPMLDGGYNELTITAASDRGFAGRWESSEGLITYHAGGRFCARRRDGP